MLYVRMSNVVPLVSYADNQATAVDVRRSSTREWARGFMRSERATEATSVGAVH